MREGAYFSPNEVYYANLKELFAEQSRVAELRISELAAIASEAAELSKSMSDEGLLPYEIIAALSDTDVLDICFPSNIAEHSVRYVKNLTALTEASDKAEFSRIYLSECRSRGIAIKAEDFFPEERGAQTFTYVKNSLSDEAYEVFSQDFADPRVYYSDSIKAASAAVADGKIGYCILPFEEKGGSRISSISDTIYKHQLKISAITPVFGFEGNADVKYALVAQSVTVPDISEEDDGYAELLIKSDSGEELTELLGAARTLELSVYKVCAVSFGAPGDSESYYSVILKMGNEGFEALLVYLSMFLSECDIVGLYKNLE